MKIASIGQAIMQASRPRVLLAPLQFGLGVQMHHHFGSRFLIDALHCHGFCCSYNEVQQFERNAALSHNTDIPNYRSEFVQYAADNVDHNSRTLDGHNTFHGMGMIVAITPENQCAKPIPRVKVTYKDVAIVGRVPIHFHKQERLGTEAIKFENLCSFKAQNQEANLDILWKTSILFGSPRPSWSGMMQFVHHGDHPGKSSVMFLPMIDMNPTDVSCIYSTLIFITEHAHRYNVQPIITFDQPLWWKAFLTTATEPANSDLRNIVLCLGGFHTEMSFLGSIGHLMAGSGLQELFELIYAPNAVVHMLAGKALARAVRAHLTIESALNALLLSDAMKINLFSTSEVEEESTSEVEEKSSFSLLEVVATDLCSRNSDLQEAFVLYENLMNNSLSVHQVCQKEVVQKLKESLKSKVCSLQSSRTASLWIQYLDMIDILRNFIRAQRSGNWELHLQSLSDMLPYLAASGHNHYTKCVWIYLQQMSKLEDEHPTVYHHFIRGLHVVRRSDRLWAGLPTDLVIEQALMRTLKTTGGLTRGRGMTEQQRLTWVMAK